MNSKEAKRTNADAIREMTDKELADFLCESWWKPEDKEKCLEWLKKS